MERISNPNVRERCRNGNSLLERGVYLNILQLFEHLRKHTEFIEPKWKEKQEEVDPKRNELKKSNIL